MSCDTATCKLGLDDLLDRTNDWLKFAEAKNGALLALNAALLFAAGRLITSFSSLDSLVVAYAVVFIVCALSAVVLGLSALLPRLTPPWWINFPSPATESNILYFGEVCGHSRLSFLETYYSITGVKANFSKLEQRYADQIIANSKIAYLKYKYFEAAAALTMCAILTPIGFAAYWYWRR